MLPRFAGIDVRAWYPAHPSTPEEAADWTYATQVRAAEACFKAGYPFAIGCGGMWNRGIIPAIVFAGKTIERSIARAEEGSPDDVFR